MGRKGKELKTSVFDLAGIIPVGGKSDVDRMRRLGRFY